MSTILVVDDESAIRDFVRTALEDEGYDVSTATNGQHALETIQATPPDLVLMDVMMPGLSGWDVARRIRSQPLLATTPVIMMSAVPLLEVFVNETQAFVRKPFDLDELLVLIGSALTAALPRDACPAILPLPAVMPRMTAAPGRAQRRATDLST